MKLVAQLRIKNALLTIEECLAKLSQLVDEIVIVDNGSTDGTLDIYKKFPKIVSIEHTKGFDEGRDKCLALELAKKRKPDWILWIDGDEIFESSTCRTDLEKYMKNPKINEVTFRMFNFWLSKTQYRVDGKWLIYTLQPQRQMWRNIPSANFNNVRFHNGGISGLSGKSVISNLRIKHYGYIDQDQIKKKYANYNNLKDDPRFGKTMPVNEDYVELRKFVEHNMRVLNQFWQFIEIIILKIILYKRILLKNTLFKK